jgi:hypothetical protein
MKELDEPEKAITPGIQLLELLVSQHPVCVCLKKHLHPMDPHPLLQPKLWLLNGLLLNKPRQDGGPKAVLKSRLVMILV